MADIQQLRIKHLEAEVDKWFSKFRKAEAALRQIKELHHGPEDENVSVIDSIFMRDDRTYKIVCDILEELSAPQKRV